jgi:Undecaprenyl-phosphate glucose phosphotransferase
MIVLHAARRTTSHLHMITPCRKGPVAVSLPVVSDVLCAVDGAALALLAFLAYDIYVTALLRYYTAPAEHVFFTAFVVLTMATLLHGRFLAQLSRKITPLRASVDAIWRWSVAISAALSLAFAAKISEDISRGWVILWYVYGLFYFLGSRAAIGALQRHLSNRGYLRSKAIIIGAGNEGRWFLARLEASSKHEIAVLGFFDDRQGRGARGTQNCPLIGTSGDALAFARDNHIDEVIIALPPTAISRIGQIVAKLTVLPVDIHVLFSDAGETLKCKGVRQLADLALFNASSRPLKHWNGLIKRIEDIVAGAGALALCAPMMAIIALLIKLESRGPAIFSQVRFGFNNERIVVHKFRTMYCERCDASGARQASRNDPRVTRVGRFLRKASLDELPQLFDVVAGDMSIVGPRPHPVAMRVADRPYSEAVSAYFARHRVKPGLTGLAQVNGWRGETDTLFKAQKRLECDLHYIENWSLLLDIKIMARTFVVVARGANAY